MIVIDASSLSKYILREMGWKEVESSIDADEPVCSIDYMLTEVTNSIRTAHLKKQISESEALTIFSALEKAYCGLIHIELSKYFMKEALILGMKEKTSVYDALYLVQALKYGKLITSDEQQSKIGIKLGIVTTYIR